MSFTVPSPADALLSAQNVTMRFGGIVAVNEMNVALPKGRLGERVYGLLKNAGFPCPVSEHLWSGGAPGGCGVG